MVRYRMAYAGVIHLLDKYKKPLRTLRFAATAEDRPHGMLDRMERELVSLRRQAPDAKVVVVQDLVQPMLDEVAPGWEGLVDWYHVSEHLADAARAIHPKLGDQTRQLRAWQCRLRSASRACTTIARALDKQAAKRRGAARKRLQNHADYLFFNDKTLNYARFRRHGWPIGSGPLEGACKSTIKQRANRSGQRWSNEGLRGVLALRSLDDSLRLLTSIDELLSLQRQRVFECRV